MLLRVSFLSALAAFVMCAQTQANTPLTFDVASVKPANPSATGGFIRPLPGGQTYRASAMPLRLMFKLMYKITDKQIVGAPSWMDNDLWDVEGKAGRASNIDELHEMFQNLLAERFQLKFHRDKREMSAMALTVDKSGARLKRNESPESFEIPIKPAGPGMIAAVHAQMSYFCWFLAQQFNGPVVDQTGLDGYYDFNLKFMPPGRQVAVGANPGGRDGDAPPGLADLPSIFDALRQQLGLKLESRKAPVEVFVIDHVERPEPN